ncbi:MAG: hypothetical protein ACOC57_02140, partial [Acidobacteriota bacterium]
MDIQVVIVAYSLIFLLVFTFSLFFLIVGRRIVFQKIEKRNERIRQEIESKLLVILPGRPSRENLHSLESYVRYPKIFTRVLVDLWSAMSGNIRERIKQVFDDLLKEKLLRDLTSRSKLKRLKAVRPFVMFSKP